MQNHFKWKFFCIGKHFTLKHTEANEGKKRVSLSFIGVANDFRIKSHNRYTRFPLRIITATVTLKPIPLRLSIPLFKTITRGTLNNYSLTCRPQYDSGNPTSIYSPIPEQANPSQYRLAEEPPPDCGQISSQLYIPLYS